MTEEYVHPSFQQPDDVNVKVWRYLSFERLKWLVEEGRLYMAQPSQLEAFDNFEGTMPRAQSAWFDELAQKANSDEKAKIIRENKEKMLGFARMYRTGWFVSCWHMEEHENYAFWEIYGRHDHSVAIVSNYSTLKEVLPDHIEIGCVKYIDFETQDFAREGDNLPNLFDYVMHKRHFYRYEKEIRAVASAHSHPRLGGDEIRANIVNGSYAPRIDTHTLIREVVVHPRASAEFLAEVREFCAVHNLPDPRLSGLSETPMS